MTDRPAAPALEVQPAPCPKCGALTEDDAETKCQPTQDQTGEWNCPGTFNVAGESIQPTPAYLNALDHWCKADLARMEAEDAATATPSP